MTVRDWKWTVCILSGVIIFLFSYKFWDKAGNLTEIISIGSGLVSIALAITAIIIAVAEGVKTSNKEKKIDNTLDSIIANLKTMSDIINKNNSQTHTKLSRIEEYMKYYEKSTGKLEEVKESEGSNSNNVGIESEANVKAPEETKTNVQAYSEKEKNEDMKSKNKNNSPKFIVKRGDIFFADLSHVVGSEQGGVRPVLVIQNDIGNRFSPTLTIAPITAQIQKAKLPTHVEIDAKLCNFDRDSVILLEQIRTIDKIGY